MVKFGTSGLRGLATNLTDDLVARYVFGFVRAFAHTGSLYLACDRRASSPRLAAAAAAGARAAGVDVVWCGVVPTPALGLAAEKAGTLGVMITGSHIPADRNGLKFYTSSGEITKADEVMLRAGAEA